jgi:hypothetical protein
LRQPIPTFAFPELNQIENIQNGSKGKKQLNLKRLRNFRQESLSAQLLFFETFFLMTFSRLMILFKSFKKLASYLGKVEEESSLLLKQKEMFDAEKIASAIKKVSQFVPFRAMCFEQALTAKIMLNRRNISSTIYFGLAKQNNYSIKAHAWTRVGHKIITGRKHMNKFKVVSFFGTKFYTDV